MITSAFWAAKRKGLACTKKFLLSFAYMQDALRTFLLRKLDNLAKDDKCQITMISTWATELYLDKVLLIYLTCIIDKKLSQIFGINWPLIL